MTRPIRLRVLRTDRPHWASHSGCHQFLRYLDPAKYRLRLQVVSDSDADLPLPTEAARNWVRRRIQRRGMPYYKLSDLAAEIKAIPSCLTGTVDVLHYLDGEHTAQYLPRLLKRSPVRHTKTLATFHQPPQLLHELVNKDVAAQLDHVALVSPVQKTFFEYLPQERVSVLMHGIDVDFYQPASEPVPETPFRCITVGHWLRDWSTFRFVARALPAVEFHYVTDRKTGLEDLSNVIFHRNVDDRSLRSLYQQSHLLFLPLTGATANNTLLEGIACGLPVVATDLDSIRAYLGEAGVLVEGNDADRFANAIGELQCDRNLRTALARKSRARAEELSWRNLIPAYESLYSRLAAGG